MRLPHRSADSAAMPRADARLFWRARAPACCATPGRFPGTIGPDLRGVGARLTPGQMRLRLVDATRLNPDTVMPPYYRVDGLTRVADAQRGKPILTAQEIEDVIAFLATLQK